MAPTVAEFFWPDEHNKLRNSNRLRCGGVRLERSDDDRWRRDLVDAAFADIPFVRRLVGRELP
jgi:hypothetical protein